MFLTKSSYRPGQELNRLQSEMSQLFDGLFGVKRTDFSPLFAFRTEATWPHVDVAENEAQIIVTAELPGLKQDEINVELQADSILISGEKKDERPTDGHNYRSVERVFGRFERFLSLPSEVDRNGVEATFENGVLTVILPKVVPVAKSQKIMVKGTN